MLINKAQVSVSTAARQTGHLRFQIVISFSDLRKPNLSNLLVGACIAGMAIWMVLGTKDSGCLRKLATASPTVAEKSQSGAQQYTIMTAYPKVEIRVRAPD